MDKTYFENKQNAACNAHAAEHELFLLANILLFKLSQYEDVDLYSNLINELGTKLSSNSD